MIVFPHRQGRVQAPRDRLAVLIPTGPAAIAGIQSPATSSRRSTATEIDWSFSTSAWPPHSTKPGWNRWKYVVDRDGEVQPPVYVNSEVAVPDSAQEVRRQIIGILPGMTGRIGGLGPEADPNNPRHPHLGDVIVEVAGNAVTDTNATEMLSRVLNGEGPTIVERSDPKNPDAPPERIEIEIPPVLQLYPSDRDDLNPDHLLGMVPLTRVSDVTAGRQSRSRRHRGGRHDPPAGTPSALPHAGKQITQERWLIDSGSGPRRRPCVSRMKRRDSDVRASAELPPGRQGSIDARRSEPKEQDRADHEAGTLQARFASRWQ